MRRLVAVSRVISSRLHAQYTRFLSISLIYRRCSRICALKMFTQQPPYDGDSSAKDRSKPPRRIGLLRLEDWNKLWEILVVCWSADPLDRPTASDLEARLSEIAGRSSLRSSFLKADVSGVSRSSFLVADATQTERFSTLTCLASSSTHFDDGIIVKEITPLARSVKNLIETWEDLSVSHKEAHALTKRLEVRKIRASVCNNNTFIKICVLEIYQP